MPLETIPVDPVSEPMPAEVEQLLEAAECQEVAYRATSDVPNVRFHSSNFRLVYHMLRSVMEQGLLPARSDGRGSLCEWGAGLAVTSGLWSLLGGAAWGIELDERLVERARDLHQQFSLEHVEVLQGNYLPSDARSFVDEFDDLSHMTFDGDIPYGASAPVLADYDVVFVYPWPGEIRLVTDVFDSHARQGALLLGFLGADTLHLWRKA